MIVSSFFLLGKYNRSSIKGDENSRIASISSVISTKIQPLLDKRGREQLSKFIGKPENNLKYNRSSIKGDENYYQETISSYRNQKYNRSSIKGDENKFVIRDVFSNLFKYNRSSIKGDENFLDFLRVLGLQINTTAPR